MRNDALELTHLFPTADRVFEVKAVTLASGLTLPYVEQGDPAGVPLILLHGYTDSWRSFAGLLKHLPATFRTIALSQRGHGDAGRPRQGYIRATSRPTSHRSWTRSGSTRRFSSATRWAAKSRSASRSSMASACGAWC